MSSPLIAAAAVTVAAPIVVAVVVAVVSSSQLSSPLSLSPRGRRRVVIIAIATATIIMVSRWRRLSTTGSVGQYMGDRAMQWYGASGVAAGPATGGGLNAREGTGGGGGVVAAVAVRDEMGKKKDLSKGPVEPNGERDEAKLGVASRRGGVDIGGHNTAAVPLRCPTAVHVIKTGHQYTHAANAYTAAGATYKPKELPWHPLSTQPPRQWRHDDNGNDRDEVMTTRLQGNEDDHDHNGDGGGGGRRLQ
ncbi:hypothetical protein BJY52DRAFT_1220785 [Lactarius psammicola]|nr:hypothetical protein BJY52DRAFT_1220785 [Lactarius psammicola]